MMAHLIRFARQRRVEVTACGTYPCQFGTQEPLSSETLPQDYYVSAPHHLNAAPFT